MYIEGYSDMYTTGRCIDIYTEGYSGMYTEAYGGMYTGGHSDMRQRCTVACNGGVQ